MPKTRKKTVKKSAPPPRQIQRPAAAAKAKLRFKCPHPGCGKLFQRNDRMQSHMHLHTGTQPYKCEQPGCGKAFSEKHNLRIHMRTHLEERPYVCSLGCGKSFRTKGNCKDHERRHLKEK